MHNAIINFTLAYQLNPHISVLLFRVPLFVILCKCDHTFSIGCPPHCISYLCVCSSLSHVLPLGKLWFASYLLVFFCNFFLSPLISGYIVKILRTKTLRKQRKRQIEVNVLTTCATHFTFFL